MKLNITLCILFFPILMFASGRSETDTPATLRVAGLKGPTSIGMLKLFAHPPVLSQNCMVAMSVADEPEIMTARVLSGEADIAAVPINLAAVLYNKGAGIRIAAITGNGNLYLVTGDPDIQTIDDLRDKTIYGIGRGATPEFVFRYILEQNKLKDGEDLFIDFSLNHLEAAAQAAAGLINYVVLPEPFVTIVLSKAASEGRILYTPINLQDELINVSSFTADYPMTALIIKEEICREYPALVAQFLNEYRKSLEWALAEPKEAGRLGNKFLGLPAPIIEKAMPRLNIDFSYPKERKEDVIAFYSLLYSFAPASVGGKVPDNEIFFQADR